MAHPEFATTPFVTIKKSAVGGPEIRLHTQAPGCPTYLGCPRHHEQDVDLGLVAPPPWESLLTGMTMIVGIVGPTVGCGARPGLNSPGSLGSVKLEPVHHASTCPLSATANHRKLVTMAMNGWDEGHRAWWLTLEAHPVTVVRLARQHPRPVHARAVTGEERDRLWQRGAEIDVSLDTFASRRSIETPVIVLEPRD